MLKKATDSCLVTFFHANGASDLDDCGSQHGFAIFFGQNLISWSSRKQKVVAHSSTEAEYQAITFFLNCVYNIDNSRS